MNKKVAVIINTLCVTLMIMTGCGTASPSNNTAINTNLDKDSKVVIATTYPVYDWAKNVIGDTQDIDLKYLVDSNSDLHSYQPSAEDIVTYKNADLILSIGGESEEWIKDLSIDDSKVVTLLDYVSAKEEEKTEGMQAEDHGEEPDEVPEYDEHIWLSIRNAQVCVNTITEKVSEIDTENASAYKENADNYNQLLSELDSEYKKTVETASCTTLLFGDRFPFRYLVDDYGLSYYAAFSGCSAETEASFETIAFLAEKIDELNLNNVCVISNDHDIAASIISATKTKNQNIEEFNSMQSISNKTADSESYIKIMEDNLKALKTVIGG